MSNATSLPNQHPASSKSSAIAPPRFEVVFHRNEKTGEAFLLYVLQKFLRLTTSEARNFLATLEKSGQASFGDFDRDFAETKNNQILLFARENKAPLLTAVRRKE